MRGIRIQRESQEPSPSSFPFFFAPILPRLAPVHWLYESFPFSFDRDDMACAAAFDGMPDNDGYIVPNTLLPRFARYVNDDWSSLFGFDSFPDAATVFSRLQPRDYDFMGKHIDLCFFSLDGALWDFYAQDETLIRAISEHVSSLAHVQGESVEFADFIY